MVIGLLLVAITGLAFVMLMWIGMICQLKFVCRAVDDMVQEYQKNNPSAISFNKVAPKQADDADDSDPDSDPDPEDFKVESVTDIQDPPSAK